MKELEFKSATDGFWFLQHVDGPKPFLRNKPLPIPSPVSVMSCVSFSKTTCSFKTALNTESSVHHQAPPVPCLRRSKSCQS